MADETVKVEITGEAGSAISAMRAATDSVRGSVTEMKGHLEALTAAGESLKTMMVSIAAVFAGGKLFGEAISQTVEWSEGVRKLSEALGITTEQASTYQGALVHIGATSEQLIGATQLMTRQLAAHAGAFQALGISARDADGSMRPILDVFQDSLEVLRNIDDPIQRNIAGMELFGRGWSSVRELMQLTNGVIQDSAERMRALGLAIGPEQEQQTRAYKEQLNDLKLVGTALSQTIGNELIPALTAAGAEFASVGPQIGTAFGDVLKDVLYVVIELGTGLQELGTQIGGLLASIGAALKGNFSEARTILDETYKDLERIDNKATEMQDKLLHPGTAGASGKRSGAQRGDISDIGDLLDIGVPVEALLKKLPKFDPGEATAPLGGAGGDSGVGHQMGRALNTDLLAKQQAEFDKMEANSLASQGKNWFKFFDGISSGFKSVLTGVLQGTRSLGSAFQGLFDSVLSSIASMLADVALQWIEKEVLIAAFGKTRALGMIAGHSGEAGAGGVASMAAAPFPINLGAPAFGASMAALASSFSGVVAAAGGFDVPSGATPLTLLHPREMVLPAHLADSVRDMAGGGGATVILKTERLSSTHDIVKRSDLVGLLKQLNGRFAFG